MTTASTASRLLAATGTVPFSTRETVLGETPASRAMSRIVTLLLIKPHELVFAIWALYPL